MFLIILNRNQIIKIFKDGVQRCILMVQADKCQHGHRNNASRMPHDDQMK